MKPTVFLSFLLAAAMLFVPAASGSASPAGVIGTRCYVDHTATLGSKNGTSWSNAYLNPQEALADTTCAEIWVAEGTYRPTADVDNRSASFVLNAKVKMYGGFASGASSLTERNFTLHETILSGDLKGNDAIGGNSDNSLHVVRGGTANSETLLDGFTISGGNADTASTPPELNNAGGGIYIDGVSPNFSNLFITHNSAGNSLGSINGYGAGMYMYGSDSHLTQVTFDSNTATHSGGGLSLSGIGNTPHLSWVTFDSNHAMAGGGMDNFAASPLMEDIVFNNNTATASGSGMLNENTLSTSGTLTLTRATFTNNHGGANGAGLYCFNGTCMLTDVSFSHNNGYMGAGLYNSGATLILSRATFHGNTGTNAGGGFYNNNSGPNPPSVALFNVTFDGNSAPRGGGMYNNGTSIEVQNATFTGNTATAGGEDGDGIYTLTPFSLNNTILWGNGTEITNAGVPAMYIADSVIQNGCLGNISCENVLATSPDLGPLQNNGGSTETLALGRNSSAIDAGGTLYNCASTDQRGVSRPQDGNLDGVPRCDIGAYEWQPFFLWLPLVTR